ncbi:MAG: filamentous hemagglutinin N-terminal domain-containing protein [Candidatus Omnitrophica bacterium]|nr:filamentous hemagglutinin N-terminal domain-containing protein [Candidatus Omnitrophota bacterium]
MRKPSRSISILVLAAFLMYPLEIHAQNVLPQGAVATLGDAKFDYVSQPGILNVNVTVPQNRADYDSFSVGKNNAVNFNGNAPFTFINTVIGTDPSNIFGAINAPNGQIFLINHNGILFAQGSSVNAAGLVASTLDLNESDFLAGRYTFLGKGGSVVNRGYISTPGGFVVLLGSTVENSGVIEANLGSVILASGEAITLSLDPQGVVAVVIDKKTSQNLANKDSAVKNTGRITANGGKVLLTAKVLDGIFKNAVNNEGIIEARSLVGRKGEIVLIAPEENSLVSNTGLLDVSASEKDADGGLIELSAPRLNMEHGSYRANGLGGRNGILYLDPWDYTIGDDQGFFEILSDQNMGGMDLIIEATNDINFALSDKELNLQFFDTEVFTLKAGRNIYLNDSSIVTQGGAVNLFANKGNGRGEPGNIYMGNGAGIKTNGGKVTLEGSVIDLSALVDAGSGDVDVHAEDQIINSMADLGKNINAKDVYFTAENGIGVTAPILVSADKVTAYNAGHGKIEITNTRGFNARSVINNGGAFGDDVYLRTTAENAKNIEVGVVKAAGFGNVSLDASGSITDNDRDSMITANRLWLSAGNDIGTAANRINTNVNHLSGISKGVGDIYINQATAVTINDMRNMNGLIDIIAGGRINAMDISTYGGTQKDGISLRTVYGDIEVGKVTAAGLGDVLLDAAGNITDEDADSLVTADQLTLASGIIGSALGAFLTLGIDINTSVVDGHQMLAINNLPGASGYNIYFRPGVLTDVAWQKVAANVPASTGAVTQWLDPATDGVSGSYYAEVSSTSTGGVGALANRINTDVNDISARSRNIGDIYLEQAKAVGLNGVSTNQGLIDIISADAIAAQNISSGGGAADHVKLKALSGDLSVANINSAGDLSLEAVNGSILGTGTGPHVTSGGDANLTAGHVIGSWIPYKPLNINVTKDLYLAAGGRDSLAAGSAGEMPVSGTLEGVVGEAYKIDPGTRSNDLADGEFAGDPSGYVFVNNTEIWPKVPVRVPVPEVVAPDPGLVVVTPPIDLSLMQQQLSMNTSLRTIYDPAFRTVSMDRVATTGVYFYHPLTVADASAFDGIALDSQAYEFIDRNIDLKSQNSFPLYYQSGSQDQRKSK